jgi:hypothetical protein
MMRNVNPFAVLTGELKIGAGTLTAAAEVPVTCAFPVAYPCLLVMSVTVAIEFGAIPETTIESSSIVTDPPPSTVAE